MKTFILTILFGPLGFLFGVSGTNARKRNEKLIREVRRINKATKQTPKQEYHFQYKGFLKWLNY